MGKRKKILLLDYETDELIEEYESIEAAAYDNWLTRNNLIRVLNKYNGVMKLRKLKFAVKDAS